MAPLKSDRNFLYAELLTYSFNFKPPLLCPSGRAKFLRIQNKKGEAESIPPSGRWAVVYCSYRRPLLPVGIGGFRCSTPSGPPRELPPRPQCLTAYCFPTLLVVCPGFVYEPGKPGGRLPAGTFRPATEGCMVAELPASRLGALPPRRIIHPGLRPGH
jgi:hypothetical protein